MSNITRETGNRIRYYRKNLKMSQEQLAEKSSLHPAYIGQLERGEKSASIETIYKVTRALNISISDFYTNIEMMQTDNLKNPALDIYYLISQEPLSRQIKILEMIKLLQLL